MLHVLTLITQKARQGKDKVVGFAQPTAEDVEVHALADHDELAEMMRGPQNHIPREQQANYNLPIIPLDNAFITSQADVPGPRKVDLQDADITPSTRSAFDALCEKYPKVFSKGNEDIGRTQLVTMDIDTGDSPPASSRPYTLALKHHMWVQEEIETLERAGVIAKSMSPWASPIVVVPKKSQPGEPPRRDYVLTSEKSMTYNKRSSQKASPKVAYLSSRSPKLMKCTQN